MSHTSTTRTRTTGTGTSPSSTPAAGGRPASTDTDWVLCRGCHSPVYAKRLARNLHVCPECQAHQPLTAEQRLEQLADNGSRETLRLPVGSSDPLGFVDTVPYTERLAEARHRTGMDEAVLCARATIEGSPVILAVMDFRFMGGSLGSTVGELITLAIETALAERTPLLIVTASGGARMQEGALSLMQMAKTSAALGQLDRAGILTISLITDPTFGGVAASFATLTDVIVAEPGARLGFAGRRVIEQTIRQVLPAEFQTAEFLLERGFIDMTVPRARLRAELGKLLRLGSPAVREGGSPPAVREGLPSAAVGGGRSGRSSGSRTVAHTVAGPVVQEPIARRHPAVGGAVDDAPAQGRVAAVQTHVAAAHRHVAQDPATEESVAAHSVAEGAAARDSAAEHHAVEDAAAEPTAAEHSTAQAPAAQAPAAPHPMAQEAIARRPLAVGAATPHPTPEGPAARHLVVRDPEALPPAEPWQQVGQARALDRPTTLDYLALAFQDFQELHGDRVSGDCPATVGGTAWLDGRPVVVIGHQKGHDPHELMRRNFGMSSPAGYRKAARLMRLADKLGLPLVTLVDTPGAYPGADAEERGQAVAIAENLKLMSFLGVPVVTVVIGEGGSGGALALAVANRVLMFSNSVYSVISPEGCASIVWKDATAAPLAAEALRLNSSDLLRLGVVDGVLPEPEGGTGADPLLAADGLRSAIGSSLRELDGLSGQALGADRRARFRQFGAAVDVEAELWSMSDEAR